MAKETTDALPGSESQVALSLVQPLGQAAGSSVGQGKGGRGRDWPDCSLVRAWTSGHCWGTEVTPLLKAQTLPLHAGVSQVFAPVHRSPSLDGYHR